jgi:hypothetical protein
MTERRKSELLPPYRLALPTRRQENYVLFEGNILESV